MSTLTPQSGARGHKPLEGIELSKKVAELYGIDALTEDCRLIFTWLHEDSARCFELAHEYEIGIIFSKKYGWVTKDQDNEIHVEDGSIQAYRTAILQCLVAMKESE